MKKMGHVEEWSLKHAVIVDDFKSALMCNTSQSCLEPHTCVCEGQRCSYVRDTDKTDKNVRATRCSVFNCD